MPVVAKFVTFKEAAKKGAFKIVADKRVVPTPSAVENADGGS